MTGVFHTATEEETIAVGRQLASELPRKAVVLLIGNLGAGKTTLAKGIVQGLGAAAPEEVSSPTFTLIHEFADRVYHVDLYRLDTAAEVSTLGLDEIFERFPELMPSPRIEIRIETSSEESRRIEVTTHD